MQYDDDEDEGFRNVNDESRGCNRKSRNIRQPNPVGLLIACGNAGQLLHIAPDAANAPLTGLLDGKKAHAKRLQTHRHTNHVSRATRGC